MFEVNSLHNNMLKDLPCNPGEGVGWAYLSMRHVKYTDS